MTETVTHDELTGQPDHFAEIAAELRRAADNIETLVGSGLPKPAQFQFNIQPGQSGPRERRDDDVTARAVDAMAMALLGKPGAPELMSRGDYFYSADGQRGPIVVSIYQSVSTAWVEKRHAAVALPEKEAELAKLRAEVAALRAAAAPTLVTDAAGLDYTRADTDADDPTPVSPARPPAHWGGMVGSLDGGQLVTAELKPWESADPLADRIAESMEPIPAGPDLAVQAYQRHYLGLEESHAQARSQCPPECRQNWTRASDPLVHVDHCPVARAEQQTGCE